VCASSGVPGAGQSGQWVVIVPATHCGRVHNKYARWVKTTSLIVVCHMPVPTITKHSSFVCFLCSLVNYDSDEPYSNKFYTECVGSK
jgi:hypothetical protein